MAQDYAVQQGECIGSIAYDNGFFWATIWNHASNAGLKTKRKDPNVLLEGDMVHIPDLTPKQVAGATEKRHKFQLKGVPAKIKLRFLHHGQPRANIPYQLYVDGISSSGTTDGDGFVQARISPNARKARIVLKVPNRDIIYNMALGHLDPIDTPSGAAQRLANLGYAADDDPAGSVRAFQREQQLQETGEMDDSTRRKLKELFGQ
jgi:N-acetylmuramoyl-L-alanine amidase